MFKSLLIYGVSEGLAKMAPFVSSMFLAALLSAEAFGFLGIILIISELLFVVISINLQVILRITYFQSDMHAISRRCSSHLVASTVIFVAAIPTVWLILRINVILCILFVSYAWLRTVSSFYLTILQCRKKSFSYSVANILYVSCLAFLSVLIVWVYDDYLCWIVAAFMASLFQFLWLNFQVFRQEKLLSITFCSVKEFIKSVTLGVLFMPQALGWWLKVAGDRFAISKWYSGDVLGEYTLAFQYANVALTITAVLNLVAIPDINELLQRKNNSDLKWVIGKNILIATIGMLMLLLAGGIVLDVYFAGKYPNSKFYFIVLCVSMFPQVLLLLVINIEYYVNGATFVAKLVLVAFLAQFLINYYVVAPNFGVEEVVLAGGIINVVCLYLVLRKIRHILWSN